MRKVYPFRFVFGLLALLLSAALLPHPVRADMPRSSIEDVIRSQIAAFASDDLDAAFSFASPSIRQLFGTSERFAQMVQGGYPMVYRAEELRMMDQRATEDQVVQRVLIRDAAGRVHVLAYQMVRDPIGGDWLINGVQILRAAETGV